MLRQASRALGGALMLLALPVAAQESLLLPQPLTLSAALALARHDLPRIELAQAERDAHAAELAAAESLSGARLAAVGRLRWIEPSDRAIDDDRNDSRVRIALSKRLFDFGYSAALESAARLAGDGSQWRYLDARQRAHLEIMQSFLHVLLADLRYARDNEAMAVAFIDVDRARDRHELQRLSDVDLLRLEADYQAALRDRMLSQSRQRAARSRLAIAMGWPDDLAADLLRPAAPDTTITLPDYETLLDDALRHNPVLQALRAEIEVARTEIEAARRRFGPVISGELDAQAYNRETNNTHPLGAALVVEIPILTGGRRDAAVAVARAALRESSAHLAAAEQALRQDILDMWLHLETLRIELDGLRVRGDYRELYLDRSRALYELEVKTDLGDAMTEISALSLDVARAEFDWMMTQAHLAALAGRLLPEEGGE